MKSSTFAEAIFLVVACLVMSTDVVAAQATARPSTSAKFRGVWKPVDPRPLLTPEDGGALPFKPEALAVYQRNLQARMRGDISFDLTSRCASPGVPRILFLPYAFEIYERADQVLFAYEFNHLYRQVVMDDTPPEQLYPSKMGVATGVWEADTLVITTTFRNDKSLLDDAIPNSEELSVTERLRRSGDVIENRVTINDPAIFLRPWTAVVHYRRQKNLEIAEDVCLDRVTAGRPAIEWPLAKDTTRR